MTITVNLSPETEQTLLAQSKARGLSVESFLQTLIATHLVAIEAMNPLQDLPPESEDRDRYIDDLFDTVHVPPGVGEGAMCREGWYR